MLQIANFGNWCYLGSHERKYGVQTTEKTWHFPIGWSRACFQTYGFHQLECFPICTFKQISHEIMVKTHNELYTSVTAHVKIFYKETEKTLSNIIYSCTLSDHGPLGILCNIRFLTRNTGFSYLHLPFKSELHTGRHGWDSNHSFISTNTIPA